jgi:hypothetical protein
MSIRRSHRRLLAWLLAAAVLFAQSAALAYACALEARQLAEVAAAPCPSHVAEAQEGDQAGGNLCEVHCQTPILPDPGVTFAFLPPAFEPLIVVGDAPAASLVPSSPPEPRGAPPPVLLRTSRRLI